MAGIGFESKQTENTPVTRVEYGQFRVRYAYSLSYERVTGNRPSNDYLEWSASGDTLVFALCDGVETSFAGGSAARFLGRRLVEWLSALPAEQTEDLDQVKHLLDASLVEWMPAAQRAVRSKVKASEAVFTCGRIVAGPDGLRGFMAGSGLVLVRLYDRKNRDISFTPLRHAYDRWSTLRGLRGQTFVEPLGPRPPLQRMMLFTDGLSELEEKLAGYSDADLQTAILESFMSVLNDDISLLDVEMCDPPAGGRPRKTVTGAQQLPPVHLERVDDALEWETRDDTIYSILEMRDSRGQQVLSAGNFFSWRPPLETACEYRTCLVSAQGRAFSPWLAWDPHPADEARGYESGSMDEEETASFAEDDLPALVEQEHDYDLEQSEAPDKAEPVETPPGAAEPPEEIAPPRVDDEPAAPPPVVEPLAQHTEAEAEPQPESIPNAEESPAAEQLNVEDIDTGAPVGEVASLEPVEEPLQPKASLEEQPVEVQPAAPQETPLEAQPPEEETAPQPSFAGRAARLFSRLPDVRSVLRQAQGLLRVRAPSTRPAPELTGIPWIEKGKYPGQYILHWQASPGANEYEIWDQPQEQPEPGVTLRTSDTRLRLENLPAGRHHFRIRPLGTAFAQDWQTWPGVDVDIPAGIKNPPAGVRVEADPDESELTLRWAPLDNEVVEEYWIFEVGHEEHRLIGKVAGDTNRFRVRKIPGDRPRRFLVRAVNWGGLGPASELAVYQPGAAPAAQNRIPGRRERPASTAAPEQRIAQVPELCDAVNRWTRSQNVQMTAMKLEQRYENVEQYILLENRKLNQLVSLPLLKGPEYRLTVYGARGEVLVVEIRFEKRTWVFLVKFLPVLRRG